MDGACRAKVTVGQATVELEGTEQFVREELTFFKEAWISKASPPVIPPVVPAPQTPTPDAPAGAKPNIKEFIAGMTPKTDMEKAAIVAYYLKSHHAVEELTGKVLNQWFVNAGWKPSPKPGNTLDNAMRQRGYFVKGTDSGKFKLSDAGTYYVEQESKKPLAK